MTRLYPIIERGYNLLLTLRSINIEIGQQNILNDRRTYEEKL